MLSSLRRAVLHGGFSDSSRRNARGEQFSCTMPDGNASRDTFTHRCYRDSRGKSLPLRAREREREFVTRGIPRNSLRERPFAHT